MSQSSISVSVASGELAAVDADVLVLPVTEADTLADCAGVDAATGGDIGRALASREFRGKVFEISLSGLTGWRTRRVLLIGAGAARHLTTDRWRKIASAAALAVRQRRMGRLCFVTRPWASTPGIVQAIVEGLLLATFDGDTYKTERDAVALSELTVHAVDAASAAAAVRRGNVLGSCSNLARGLANEPGNILPPRVFAERAAGIIEGSGVSFEVLDEKHIADLNMGLLLGVAQGSAEPPRFMVMRHAPSGVTDGPVLGLVGKGITFDTGGISLKPADGMERMKDDMAGGAAVVAAMRAIGLLGAPVRVIGIVPSAENMPGGRAIRPGDVLKGASGKTVEVNNTDAEGRLVLADALWYARQQGVTHLVDVATLTGACVVALGKVLSGLFGAPDGWVTLVRETAEEAGDRCWPMPVYDEYADQLKSEIADIVNTGGRPGGAVTAAMFLKEFTGGLPWAHLDIAGTAWAEEPKPYQPKGPVGIAVRTLAELAFTSDRWPT
ncbi:MAG: leucyl aminopeptidase [Vicinamibacterales bacterium]